MKPARTRGVVLTSGAYFPDANSLATLVPLVDRTIYPADRFPDGQWDYYRYYTTHFTAAVADLDADPAATLASVYRPGDPSASRQGRDRRPRSPATAGVSAPHIAPRRPRPTPRSGRRRTSTPSCRRYKKQGLRFLPARGTPTTTPTSPTPAKHPTTAACRSQYCSSTASGTSSAPSREIARATRCSQPVQTSPWLSVPAGHWLPLERKTELVHAIRTWLEHADL